MVKHSILCLTSIVNTSYSGNIKINEKNNSGLKENG